MTTKPRSKTLPVGTIQCEHLKIIRLHKSEHEKDMGFKTNFCDKGTVVSYITRDSAAYRNGTLQVGDLILWIEKVNIQHATADKIDQILQNTPEVLRMVVSQTFQNKTPRHTKARAGTVLGGTINGPAQLIPNISTADEPYAFEVTYLPQLDETDEHQDYSDEEDEYEEQDGDEQ